MMGWMETMFGVPDKTPEQPTLAEPTHRFLVVTKEYGHSDGDEYFDADQFTPHLPDPQTLVIQRQSQRAPVMHYGPFGWLRFRWVQAQPSKIAHLRVDKRL